LGKRLTRHQLRGHYYRMGEPQSAAIKELELTDEQLLLTAPLVGQRTFSYELDGDALLLSEHQELRFTNEGYGIPRRDGTAAAWLAVSSSCARRQKPRRGPAQVIFFAYV
jgi:hypothetical protein